MVEAHRQQTTEKTRRAEDGIADLGCNGSGNGRGGNALPAKLVLQPSGHHHTLGDDAVDTGVDGGGGGR